jgi:hypothetical protein
MLLLDMVLVSAPNDNYKKRTSTHLMGSLVMQIIGTAINWFAFNSTAVDAWSNKFYMVE